RGEATPDIVEQLDLADRVASELRRRRHARGALELASPEVVFRFEDGRIAEARLEGEPHAHMLVEELMILANAHVAAFLASRNPAGRTLPAQPDPGVAVPLPGAACPAGRRDASGEAGRSRSAAPAGARASLAARGDGARRRDLAPRRRVRRAVGARPRGVPSPR